MTRMAEEKIVTSTAMKGSRDRTPMEGPGPQEPTAVEGPQDRLALAKRAGVRRTSVVSVIAGVLVAYAAFAVLIGGATAVVGALGIDVDFTGREWTQVGVGAGIGAGFLLFLAYLFGGYVSGRMARRAGLTNGLLVFVGGLIVAGATVGIAQATGESGAALDRLREGLRSFGLPTSGDQWGAVGTVAGLAALAGMFLGARLGGTLGERWQSKLAGAALEVDLRERPTGLRGEQEDELAGAAAGTEARSVLEARDDPAAQGATSAEDLEGMTRAELYGQAQEADIAGRSHMTKGELAEALLQAEN